MKILGHKWKMRPYTGMESDEHSGQVIMSEKVMRVSMDSVQSEQETTVLHEVLEVINHKCELDMSHQTICTLEVELYDFFADNGINLQKLTKELHYEMQILQKRNTSARNKRKRNS